MFSLPFNENIFISSMISIKGFYSTYAKKIVNMSDRLQKSRKNIDYFIE